MKLKALMIIVGCFIIPTMLAAQNVGVGTASPSEKLEVAGIVYSNQGGIKFPDNTIQTTASSSVTTESVAKARLEGLIKIPGIKGPVNTTVDLPGKGSTNIDFAFPIYELNYNATSTISFLTDINSGTSQLLESRLTGSNIDAPGGNVITIYFLEDQSQSIPVAHQIYKIDIAAVQNFADSIDPATSKTFAHLCKITLSIGKIQIENLLDGHVFCWDHILDNICGGL